MPVPSVRVHAGNDAPVHEGGDFVVYWMIAFRRPDWNFALERAVEWAQRLDRPLVVLEPLRTGYRWASDRFDAFVLQGMAANQRHFAGTSATYYPYVESAPDQGKGLLVTLAGRAAVVVTDDFPAFFLRRMVAAAATQVRTRLERVDSNGLVPLRATERAYPTAFTFRMFLQKHLREHLASFPAADPLLVSVFLIRLPASIE